MIIRSVVCAAAAGSAVAQAAGRSEGSCAGERGTRPTCESSAALIDALSLLQTGSPVEDAGSARHSGAPSLRALYREVWVRDHRSTSFTPEETPSHLILRGPARKRGNVSSAIPPWMRPQPGREEIAFELRLPKLPCYSPPSGLLTLVDLRTQEWFLSQSRCLNLTNAQLLLGWEFEANKWQYVPLEATQEGAESDARGQGGARSFAQDDRNYWYLLDEGCRVARSPPRPTIMWSPPPEEPPAPAEGGAAGALPPSEEAERRGFGRILIGEEPPAAPCAGLLNGSVLEEVLRGEEANYVYLKDHVRKRLVAVRRKLFENGAGAGAGEAFERGRPTSLRLLQPMWPVNAAAL